jgi:hypothetical protein
MTYAETQPAGGAAKNREVDQVVTLQPGSYVVHFVTDGSHSFAEWNSTPPREPERWGITLAVANGTLSAAGVSSFDPTRDPGALARIVRVGNNADARQRLVLDRDTEVLVVAVGEGTSDGMVDFGWITEAGSGRTVWKMEYPSTEPAGGAAKNRLARARLKLPAGAYELHFESDDSHAFGRFNDAPPFDPDAWGITVLPAQTPAVVEDPHQRR